MKIFGIEFVSLSIPLERRLQTFAVAQWFFTFVVAPFIVYGLVFISLFTPIMPIMVLYLLWIFLFDRKTPKTGGRRLDMIRRLKIWDHYRDYFPISLIKSQDLDPKQNYIFGYHPHGIVTFSAMCNFLTEATGFSKIFPGITPTLLTLIPNFYIPFLREYYLSLGACDVSRESIEYLLTKNGPGNAVVIVIGGAEEALNSRPDTFQLTLKNRKGFVKIAIQTGSYLVPCFGFHENEIFNQVENPRGSLTRSIQETCKKHLGVSSPLFYGRGIFNYTFGWMPFRKPLVTVIGKPISIDRDENPSQDLIDEKHQQYLDALTDLFEENKEKYGLDANKHLVFL